MLTCHDVAEQATDYMEGATGRGRRMAVWAHLRLCPNCREYLRQLRHGVGLARRALAEAPPPAEVEDALAALFAARRPGPAE